jgi:hypothetical protein
MSAWKETYVATYGGQGRISFQHVSLQRQAMAMHDIIRIHAGNEGAPTIGPAGVERCDQPLRERLDEAKARVARCEPAGVICRLIPRTVIDDHTLPIGFTLALYTAQAGRQGGGSVTHGQ